MILSHSQYLKLLEIFSKLCSALISNPLNMKILIISSAPMWVIFQNSVTNLYMLYNAVSSKLMMKAIVAYKLRLSGSSIIRICPWSLLTFANMILAKVHKIQDNLHTCNYIQSVFTVYTHQGLKRVSCGQKASCIDFWLVVVVIVNFYINCTTEKYNLKVNYFYMLTCCTS